MFHRREPAVSRLENGMILGERYRVLALLGQGGMSGVYLVEDLKLKGKRWALKETRQLGREQYQAFIAEAEILIQLDHPFLPKIVDFFPPDEEGYCYLVMDYIQGNTLQVEFERQQRNFTVDKVMKMALQLCDLLHYLHSQKPQPIIYRDLKPSNIMLDEQNNVRLIDFGTARNFKQDKQMDTLQIGTIAFAAPEQFANQQTDARTDLYSLGAVLYYLATQGKYYYLTQTKLDHEGAIPKPLIRIINRLLMPSPMERYQSAAELKAELVRMQSIPAHQPQAQIKPAEAYSGTWQANNKLVVIGSLYAGAGATFSSLAFASVLRQWEVPHAVLEMPFNDPELYFWLNGEQARPENYRFASDRVTAGGDFTVDQEWRQGVTTWYPSNPRKEYEEWNEKDSMKLLYSIKHSLVIADISHQWDEPQVAEVLRIADEIVMVAEPIPPKLFKQRSLRRFQKLLEYQQSGKNTWLMMNRGHSMKKEWLSLLPLNPVGFIPDAEHEKVLRSFWTKGLWFDEPEYAAKLIAAFQPFLQSFFPENLLKRQGIKMEKKKFYLLRK